MVKKIKISSLIICLTTIAILCLFLFGNKEYTAYAVRAMTDEFIPTVSNCKGTNLLEEFLPVCGIDDFKCSPVDEYRFDYSGEMNTDEKNYTTEAKVEEDRLTSNITEDVTSENSSEKVTESMLEEKSDSDNIISNDTNNKDKVVAGNDDKEATEKADKEDKTEEIALREEISEDKSSDDDSNDNNESIEAAAYPNGISYDRRKLFDFNYLIDTLYNVASSTSIYPEELNGEKLLSMDMTMDLSGEDYKILIYHTHGSEAFADSREGVSEDTVIGLGDELTRILEEDYGISVYHDRTVYDMASGTLDRSGAYDYAAEGIDKILAEYPSIQVIIDLHRDGVNEDVHLVREVDGKQTAQIMLLNGMSRLNSTGDIDYLYNPYKQENLSFSLKLELAGRKMYGEFMRRIFVSGYCYNLNRRPRAALIEVGAQTNTVEEAMNAMPPLAKILYEVLKQ